MRPRHFSEFSYGFAVTAEFAHDPLYQIIDPPEFPSQRREGQAGGGADVKLNTPSVILYLQFKLSDFMVGPTARERGQFPSGRYYRFHIRNDTTSAGRTQHELLIELDRLGNDVRYIAPAFYDERDWQDFYRRGQVVANSIMFSPAILGPVDNLTDHAVAFENSSSSFGWLYSEPVRCEALPGKEFSQQARRRLLNAPALTVERLEGDLRKLSAVLEVSPPQTPALSRLAQELGWDPERTRAAHRLPARISIVRWA